MSDRMNERVKKLLAEARGCKNPKRLQQIADELQMTSEYEAQRLVIQHLIALQARYAEVNP